MPYTVDNPPEAAKNLPKHAIEIFVAAFNAAFDQYQGDEGKAMATAWSAVKSKYEKKGDEWVAKEADVGKTELQAKYAELIQESSRRVYKDDTDRIKKVLELCQSILTTPQGEEITTEALKEADACLVWLKEQAMMKSEDGKGYPASAYAYAPDPEKPSDWKLRLWEDPEKKVTRAQLGRAAAALSPGGFRGQKVDIPSADLPSVKRKIRSAYKSLDVADEEIPRWVKEAEMRTLISEFIPLTEATITAKGKGQVVVIKPGFNASKKRYYPQETLARDFKVFEGVKMYSDHPTEAEEQARPERSIKDWVAVLENVRVRANDGAVIGDYTVVEPWMEAKLAKLRDSGQLNKIGVSINAVGSASKQKIEGVDTTFIEKLVNARSVDFVTEPGAGGSVEIFEANGTTFDVDLIDLAGLKERRPDMVKAIEESVRNEFTKEVKHKMELQETVDKLTKDNEVLVKENGDLKAKITEADKAQVKAEAQAKIKEAVGKAELPDAAKVRLLERFKDAETDTGVADAVKAEVEYIATLSEAGKVKGMGPEKVNPKADHEALVESFKRIGMTKESAEVAASAR